MSTGVQVKPVIDNKMMMQFIKLPWTAEIYKDDPAWVPPVIHDQKKFFNKKHGYFWEHGDAEFFVAYRGKNPVGRITAHTYSRYEEMHDKNTGFFGFYECIDDLEVSKALFDAAKQWLVLKGKTKILGPKSFTVYDPIGFDVLGDKSKMPVVGLFHSAPYYEKHVESYGFQKQLDWYCFLVQGKGDHSEALNKIRKDIMAQHENELGITYRTTTKKEIAKRADEVKKIFNVAWEGNEGHMPFTDKQFDMIFEELKLLIIPELAIFAEKDGKTIGFIFSIPDANPGLAKLNGRLYPWRLVKLLREVKKSTTLRTILMGVLPEYRSNGIDNVLVLLTIENGLELGFKQSDCSLIVETNKKMINSIKYLNADNYKGYRVYEMPIK